MRWWRGSSSMIGRSDAQGLAVVATAVWLIHPMQISTVLYVVQRMTELAALFCLCGLLAYLKGRALACAGRLKQGYAWMTAGLVLGTPLAILAKENGALLPAVRRGRRVDAALGCFPTAALESLGGCVSRAPSARVGLLPGAVAELAGGLCHPQLQSLRAHLHRGDHSLGLRGQDRPAPPARLWHLLRRLSGGRSALGLGRDCRGARRMVRRCWRRGCVAAEAAVPVVRDPVVSCRSLAREHRHSARALL